MGVGLTGWRKFLPRVYDAFFGGFSGLTPVQEEAIPVLLEGRGLLLVAPTASGKTEAVTAPLAERALDFPGQTFGLYVCPTRALANDLKGRLKERLRRCGLRLAIRHGERDTAAAREAPAFILTTPESLEVMLSSPSADRTWARVREVRAVVVDEAHQFFGTRRGLQLYFLLERLKGLAGRPLQRVCLSATVGDPRALAGFFRGSDPKLEVRVVPGARALELRVGLVGGTGAGPALSVPAWVGEIVARHRKVLVFANTRAQCDWLCWRLEESGLGRRIPVLLHYSSLDQEYRQGVERRFREEPRAVCVATSTLELGVDIGDVDAVAMWGAPHTVTGFIQRLGRGNRRTGVGLVYGACPRVKELGACEPEDNLLRFASLVYCAGKTSLRRPICRSSTQCWSSSCWPLPCATTGLRPML